MVGTISIEQFESLLLLKGITNKGLTTPKMQGISII